MVLELGRMEVFPLLFAPVILVSQTLLRSLEDAGGSVFFTNPEQVETSL